MKKKRLLVTISISFSIRYLYRTGLLRKLSSFCQVVVALTWEEKDLIQELENDGFEVHLVPKPIREPAYNAVRQRIDYWFNRYQLKSPTRNIEKRYLRNFMMPKKKLISALQKQYFNILFCLPGYSKKLFDKEKRVLQNQTNFKGYLSWVENLAIDAVFTVTPFHQQEDLLLRACKTMNKKMLTAIISFDNLTKRGWIPVSYDLYLLWNEQNRQQLERIYAFAKKKLVRVTGAPQFDFYYNDSYRLPKEEWRKSLQLNGQGRKLILYAGGPPALFPNEPQYLKHLDDAITNNEIDNSPLVLFRSHPTDTLERWKKTIGESLNIIFDVSWHGKVQTSGSNVTHGDIKKLCSTLLYTDIHINLCSTMTVDGSVFYKPQIGPAYDEINPSQERSLQKMYQQEHFLPIIKTSGLVLATSKKMFIALTNEALQQPEKFIQRCNAVVKEVITFTDGKSTERVSKEIEKFLCKK